MAAGGEIFPQKWTFQSSSCPAAEGLSDPNPDELSVCRKKLHQQEDADKARQDAADAVQGPDVCTSTPGLSQHEHDSLGQL